MFFFKNCKKSLNYIKKLKNNFGDFFGEIMRFLVIVLRVITLIKTKKFVKNLLKLTKIRK